VRLQQKLDRTTGTINLDRMDLEDIARYAFNCK